MLSEITDTAQLAHSNRSFNDTMNSSLRLINDTVDFDSVVIYRFADVNSCKRFKQVYRWYKARHGIISPDYDLKVLPNLALIETWKSSLLEGNVVNIYTDRMSEDETALLGVSGVKSILLVPVSIKNELWGCIAFQEHKGELFFCKYSADFLGVATQICIKNILNLKFTEEI